MGQFKSFQNVVESTNMRFISSTTGLDISDGSRANPWASLNKAVSFLLTNFRYLIIRGTFTENVTMPSSASFIFGDGEDAYINGTFTIGGIANYAVTIKNCRFLNFTNHSSVTINCYIKNLTGINNGADGAGSLEFCFIENCKIQRYAMKNCTIQSFSNYCHNQIPYKPYINSCIFTSEVDLYPYTAPTTNTYYPIFQYCLFRKAVQWKWNGVIIPGTSTANTIPELLTALTAYATNVLTGTQQTYLNLVIANSFYVHPSTGQSNIIVDDSVIPIFNKYNGAVPIDYTLKLSDNNPALYISDPLTSATLVPSYVGCYRVNIDTISYDDIVNVNADGTDDVVAGTMLLKDANNNFSASSSSTQYRNRTRTNVLHYKRGLAFYGMQADLRSGINNNYWFGKRQPFNKTIDSEMKLPQESIEVIPYDDMTTPSAFPRFSALFNGNTQLWYHILGKGTIGAITVGQTALIGTGTTFLTTFIVGMPIIIDGETRTVATITDNTHLTTDAWTVAHSAGSSYSAVPSNKLNTPVLFNDLAILGVTTELSLTEYGTWAVSNADYEQLALSQKLNSLTTLVTPTLAYLKLELNLNYSD